MDQWEANILRLSERELKLKKLYESGGQYLLEQAMTYAQYQEHLENGECLDDEIGQYYRDMTRNNLGSTNEEVETITKGNEIKVIRHERYSYPVLHNHSYVEILYVYSGSCIHFVEEHSFEMMEGDICILAPNATHAISAMSSEAVILNLLVSKKLFDSSFLKMIKGSQVLMDFFEHVLYNKRVSPYIIFRTEGDNWLKHTMLLMFKEENEKNYAYEKSMKLYMEQVFIHLIRRYEMQAIVTDPIDVSLNDHIVAVLGYISVNYNRLSLNETADFFGCTAPC